MERRNDASQAKEALAMLITAKVSEAESRLQAAMVQQNLAIVELERRVKALEEALRLISSGVRG
jgi:hypothetical protein